MKKFVESVHHLTILSIIIAGHILTASAASQPPQRGYSYAVVISKAAYADAGWKTVADSLVKIHGTHGDAQIFTWASAVTDVKTDLAAFKPDYIGYIARPATECNAAFIVAVSRMSRALDEDPYGDAVWGIITGYEAADAVRAISESLVVKTVLAASNNLSYEPPIQRFYQGIGMTCDSYTTTNYLFPGKSGKIYTENKRPEGEQDRIKLVAKWLNAPSVTFEIAGQGTMTGPVDCFITGGHGNVNLWQCHYSDPGTEGYMQSSGGKLTGAPYSGGSIAINSPTPKIFWCATNCLMGNPNSKDNVVYAAFHSGHAVQMFGFVNNASGGDEFASWGVYDRVTKSAGTFTLAEGFFLANNDAQFELENPTGEMTNSLVKLFMDSTVFYGDPAGNVRFSDLGDSAKAYREELTITPGANGTATFSYTYTMVAHNLEFGAGYCYQFRPISRLPVRIDPGSVAIVKNDGHKAAINDNLVIWEMLAKGETLQKGKSKTLQWTAKVTDDKTGAVRGAGRSFSGKRAAEVAITQKGGGIIVRCTGFARGTGTIRIVDQAGGECLSRRFIADRRLFLPLQSGSGMYAAVVELGGAVVHCRFAIVQ